MSRLVFLLLVFGRNISIKILYKPCIIKNDFVIKEILLVFFKILNNFHINMTRVQQVLKSTAVLADL